MDDVTSGLDSGMVMMDTRLSSAFLSKMDLLLTLMVVIFAMLCILFALLLVMLCHLYKRKSSRRGKLLDWNHLRSGGECCHQQGSASSQVFTLASTSSSSSRREEGKQEEPVYQEIKEVKAAMQKQKQKQKKTIILEEPAWAPKPTNIVYGVIAAKERAKYIPPVGLVRPEPT